MTNKSSGLNSTLTTIESRVMYYIIENRHMRPRAKYSDMDKIEISTLPARTAVTHEECLNGWCGTYYGVSVWAHGAYETIEQARCALQQKFEGARETDDNGLFFESSSTHVVETWKPAKRKRLNEHGEAV